MCGVFFVSFRRRFVESERRYRAHRQDRVDKNLDQERGAYKNLSVMAMNPAIVIGAPRWGRPWEGWPSVY